MENAILMASGMGTRMRPLTNTIPKPLVEINNTPMIETVINALNTRGIDNITVVTGYLGEQFNYLKDKYKNINIIKNPDYETVNNISSIYYACDVLLKGNCFICEADLFITDNCILKQNLNHSCYFGRFVKGHSDDWVFETDKDGFITRVGKYGDNLYNMVGISYFKADDAKILNEAIKNAYYKKGYENLFGDDVVNNNLDKLKLKVQSIEQNKIIEIDTVEELNEVRKIWGKNES